LISSFFGGGPFGTITFGFVFFLAAALFEPDWEDWEGLVVEELVALDFEESDEDPQPTTASSAPHTKIAVPNRPMAAHPMAGGRSWRSALA
jgi:hypothetical protein